MCRLNWNGSRTSRTAKRGAYQQDVKDFTAFVGIARPEEFRIVTRAHFIAWRKDLERLELAPSTIRRKLSALSSLFDHLCEQNAITHNPVDGVKRPKAGAVQDTCKKLSQVAVVRAMLTTGPAAARPGHQPLPPRRSLPQRQGSGPGQKIA